MIRKILYFFDKMQAKLAPCLYFYVLTKVQLLYGWYYLYDPRESTWQASLLDFYRGQDRHNIWILPPYKRL
jgi:hypothetical protein